MKDGRWSAESHLLFDSAFAFNPPPEMSRPRILTRMPSFTPRDWSLIGRQIALSADIAQRIIAFSPEERSAAARELRPEGLAARTASDLAESISQAHELLELLQKAERIWLDVVARKARQHSDDA
jgi:hypothetical protein